MQQGSKLIGNASSVFGYSISLSADGYTALVGAPADGGQGAAYVLTRVGSPWIQQARLTPNDEQVPGPLVQFGLSVSLSGDGNTALVGGPNDGPQSGAAWVFARSGSTWTQQGPKLQPAQGGEDGAAHFGLSAALSGDGSTVHWSSGPYDGFATVLGSVWIFARTGTVWAEQDAIFPSDAVGPTEFGASVALSSNGNTALVGGPFDGASNTMSGAAWVFTRSGSTWTQQGSALSGSDESASLLGSSVALSADGRTALIGGPQDDGNVGAAWVFSSSGSTWSQQGPKLTGSGEAGTGAFGYSVALSADGDTALIEGDNDDGAAFGAAWLFARAAGSWAQQDGKITTSDEHETGAAEAFAQTVALWRGS